MGLPRVSTDRTDALQPLLYALTAGPGRELPGLSPKSQDWTNHRHRNGQGLYGPCRLYGRRDCEFAKAGIGHRTHDLLD